MQLQYSKSIAKSCYGVVRNALRRPWNRVTISALLGILSIMPLSVSLASTQASSWYVGLQGGKGDLEDSNSPREWEPLLANARIGFFPINQLAIESRLGAGVREDSDMNVDLNVEHVMGIYAVAHAITFQDMFSLYLMGGVTQSEFETDNGSKSYMNTIGSAYGAGLDIYLHNNISVNLEYMMYLNEAKPSGASSDDTYDFPSVNAGISWHY